MKSSHFNNQLTAEQRSKIKEIKEQGYSYDPIATALSGQGLVYTNDNVNSTEEAEASTIYIFKFDGTTVTEKWREFEEAENMVGDDPRNVLEEMFTGRLEIEMNEPE